MTAEDKQILDRINAYANEVLGDIDPQKTKVSFQLEQIKPVMEEIAKEMNVPVTDIFIKYMDLATEASVEQETKFKDTIGGSLDSGDIRLHY